MTVMLSLTPDQEERLRQAARTEGIDADRLLHRLVNGALDQLAPPGARPAHPRPARGQYQVSDDFDAPLPDSFRLGAE